MAYANEILNATAKSGLTERLNAALAALAALAKYRAQRRVFKTTFNEMAVLSDRELADLGLVRSELRGVALRAAKEAVS